MESPAPAAVENVQVYRLPPIDRAGIDVKRSAEQEEVDGVAGIGEHDGGVDGLRLDGPSELEQADASLRFGGHLFPPEDVGTGRPPPVHATTSIPLMASPPSIRAVILARRV